MLGEFYEKLGDTQSAKHCYMTILHAKPDFDPARRNLHYLLYLDQQRFYPDTIRPLIATQNREVIHKARELLNQYFTVHHPNPVLRQLATHMPIVFEQTQVVGDTANLAEYDPRRHVVRLQPKMLFSTANVVAAYLVHELIHALDGSYQTSILEEQDGYRELARFWRVYQGAENDPTLDRALELYGISADRLDQEIRRVYTILRPDIAERSPGHGLPPDTVIGRAYAQIEQTRPVYPGSA
jgi:hypothetical protein